jgi:hypothetical protein
MSVAKCIRCLEREIPIPTALEEDGEEGTGKAINL